MLKLRVLFGFLMAFSVAGLLVLDHRLAESHGVDAAPGFSFLLLLVGVLGGWELYAIARRTGARPFAGWGIVLTVAVLGAFWWIAWGTSPTGNPPTKMQWSLLAFATAAGVGSVFLAQGLRGETTGAVFNISATLLGPMYLGVLGGFVLLFRFLLPQGWMILLYLIIVKWTDIGAYHAGKAFGRHKLIFWLSPGKTWEGTAGGLTTAMLFSLLFGAVFHSSGWLAVGPSLIFGLSVSIVGQLGDLAKSLLKRDAGVKDSSSAIPGFGGVLDVIDSPLMAAPVAYILWLALAGG